MLFSLDNWELLRYNNYNVLAKLKIWNAGVFIERQKGLLSHTAISSLQMLTHLLSCIIRRREV